MAISLQKGQKISLSKEAGGTLTKVVMGLGWDAVKKEKKGLMGFLGGGGGAEQEIDLDASCLMFDERGQVTDSVWFRQLKSHDGSITHTGDNRTGAGDGDDEQIIVDLSRVPPQVKSLVFTVNSFTGQTFQQVANASLMPPTTTRWRVTTSLCRAITRHRSWPRCIATMANGRCTRSARTGWDARSTS